MSLCDGADKQQEVPFCFVLFSKGISAAYTWHFLLRPMLEAFMVKRSKKGRRHQALSRTFCTRLRDRAAAGGQERKPSSSPSPALGCGALNVTLSSWAGPLCSGTGGPRRVSGRRTASLLHALGAISLAQWMKRNNGQGMGSRGRKLRDQLGDLQRENLAWM